MGTGPRTGGAGVRTSEVDRVTALDVYRRSKKESDMQRTASECVGHLGGRLFHVRRSDVAPELVDLPDWLIIAPHLRTVALIEAKSQKRKLTDGQESVLAMLAECDRLLTGVVRPDPHPGEIAFEDFMNWLEGRTA